MKLIKLFTDERAVSPVVGVALLIAITVILAAVIGGVVLGLGTGGVDTPQAQMQAQFDADGEDVEISHNGGEPLPDDQIVVVLQGDIGGEEEVRVDLSDADGFDEDALEAGNSVTFDDATTGVDIDPAADEEIESVTILWEDPNSDSTTVLEEFEA